MTIATSTTTTPVELTGNYSLDVSHTRLGFTARHAMVTKVRGSFSEFEGSAYLDAEDPTRSTAQVTISVASITTGSEQRDGHLRSADFFDVENYPTMTFVSTGVEKVDDETYLLNGELTVKDVTKPVSIEFTYNGVAKDPFGNIRAGFEGRVTVNRKDFGLNWNAALETGGFLVSEKVTLEFDVSAVKADATA